MSESPALSNSTTIPIELPRLYPLQHGAFYHGKRIGVTEASTKAGKTIGALTWLVGRALTYTDYPEHWWVAPVYEQARIAFKRAVRMFGKLPGVTYTQMPMVMHFGNGAQIQFRSAEKPDSLYGEDVGASVFDEFTRAREDAFVALLSTMTTTQGTMNLIGNVKGRGWGYKLARDAEQSDDMSYVRITADDAVRAGVMTRESLDFARARLPHNVFRELYYCEPSDDGGNPFGIDQIRACIAPVSDKPPVMFGVDLAKSSDHTVVWGVDDECGCCVLHRWQNAPWNETADMVANIIGRTPCVIDATGVGASIADTLESRGHPIERFVFTSTKKQALMGELRMAIQTGKTTIPEEARVEHEQFEYVVVMSQGRVSNVKYEAPAGLHDDYVDAHALAVHGYSTIPKGAPYIPRIDTKQFTSGFGRR